MATKAKTAPTSISFASARELGMVRKAAKLLGKSVSRYLRDLAMSDAPRVLVEHHHACPTCGNAAHDKSAAA